MNKSEKIILAASGIMAAGFAALAAVGCKGTRKLVTLALDREQPKAPKKSANRISGSTGQAEMFKEARTEAAESLKNNDCEKV